MLGIGNRQFGILPRGYALGTGVPPFVFILRDQSSITLRDRSFLTSRAS